jgi:hypothetical protein
MLGCLGKVPPDRSQGHVTDYIIQQFLHNGTLLFTAQINENNAAFLDGATDANLESAHLMSTLPLDLLLWHHRLAHHDYNLVKHMITRQLVTGIDIKSKQPPDPICQPCLSVRVSPSCTLVGSERTPAAGTKRIF